MSCQWKDKVLSVTEAGFESLALELFQFQYQSNPVYKEYTDALHIKPASVKSIFKIPFLPIRFFKSHRIQTTAFDPAAVFESSGTTGVVNSRHYLKDTELYKQSFKKAFEIFYSNINDWCIIGLLPSYLERQHSSLVFMVNELIRLSDHQSSGFYLDEFEKLYSTLKELEAKQQKTLLIGVTFALLDFAEFYSSKKENHSLQHTIIMETGGMKGRRKEMIRQEVHDILKKAFGISSVHSEYSMTELLSQAYSNGDGIFRCPPWMKIVFRDEEDPLSVRNVSDTFNVSDTLKVSDTGAINIIDLANIYSCCFIATDDAGKLYTDGSFEVLGRIDNSDLRGCSLMTL